MENRSGRGTTTYFATEEFITDTRIEKIKMAAKQVVRQIGIAHMTALDFICDKEGLGSWEEVQSRRKVRDTPDLGPDAPPDSGDIVVSAAEEVAAEVAATPAAIEPAATSRISESYLQFFQADVEFFEPRGDYIRIMRIGRAYFCLYVAPSELSICSIDPATVNNKNPKILDRVSLIPSVIGFSGKPASQVRPMGPNGRIFVSEGDLFICKYGSLEPVLWLGNVPGNFGLIAIHRELGVGFDFNIREGNSFLYQHTTPLTGTTVNKQCRNAFEMSGAYRDLLGWAIKHPKKAKEQSLNDRYMPGWLVKAKENREF